MYIWGASAMAQGNLWRERTFRKSLYTSRVSCDGASLRVESELD